MTIDGQSASFPGYAPWPSHHVHPGDHLLMRVAVTVPRNLRLTGLWLGISTGTWGNGPGGRPTGVKPILAQSLRSLSPGVHRFGLRWRVPQGRSGRNFYLISAWSSRHPPASTAGPIAVLAVR